MIRENLFVIGVLLSCVIISVLLWLFYHPPLKLTPYFIQAQSWLANRQQALQKKLVKIKHEAMDAEYASMEPSIHFEFYTSLPNMQNMQGLQSPPLMEEQSNADIKKPLPSNRIVNAEELEREFAHHLANIRGEKNDL